MMLFIRAHTDVHLLYYLTSISSVFMSLCLSSFTCFPLTPDHVQVLVLTARWEINRIPSRTHSSVLCFVSWVHRQKCKYLDAGAFVSVSCAPCCLYFKINECWWNNCKRTTDCLLSVYYWCLFLGVINHAARGSGSSEPTVFFAI